MIVDSGPGVGIVKSQGRILRTRDAARRLSLPVAVMLELRRLGVFDVRNLPPGHPGWHERDLHYFEQHLAKLQPAAASQSCAETIPLLRIMNNRHLSSRLKAALIRDVLSGAVPILRTAGPDTGDLQIPVKSYRQYLSQASRAENGTSSTAEVARQLGCDRAALPGLIRMGHLRAMRTPHALRIETQTVSRFASAYACLAPHAKALGTSTRALMHKCSEKGVDLLVVPLNGRTTVQAFIRTADLPHIRYRAA